MFDWEGITTMVNRKKSVLQLTMIALFCALSYLCLFVFRIKVSFLTFDAKDAVMTIGAMFFGPIAGFTMALVTTLLELITVSDTGFYGWLMNFLGSLSFVMPVSILYAWRKKLPMALVGLAVSIVCMTFVMMLANLYITPLYLGVSRDTVVELIPTLLFPFNLTKAILNAGIVLVLYKSVSQSLHRAGVSKKQEIPSFKFNRMTILVVIIGAALVASALFYFFMEMNGQFQIVKS